ncbi:MAG: hypothetical protein RMK94_16660, partial [Armatimonadota bacterium]|nr:hypothetical protein [Armatimonadota bacterium]
MRKEKFMSKVVRGSFLYLAYFFQFIVEWQRKIWVYMLQVMIYIGRASEMESEMEVEDALFYLVSVVLGTGIILFVLCHLTH